ncbi:hypothetical protein PENTCL1PPCAC_10222, partial [Pristionchus entomophagus]
MHCEIHVEKCISMNLILYSPSRSIVETDLKLGIAMAPFFIILLSYSVYLNSKVSIVVFIVSLFFKSLLFLASPLVAPSELFIQAYLLSFHVLLSVELCRLDWLAESIFRCLQFHVLIQSDRGSRQCIRPRV